MRAPDELRELVEQAIDELELMPELGGQAESMRYALAGGKRVRPVLCLATAEAAGVDAERALPAAVSLELV
ncbi:MAG: polyprenyl synthetase family protein, partial [Gaiellaceae bacterium]